MMSGDPRSVMTVTTIGYGDITPVTLLEKAFVCVCMIVSGFVYGYVIGAVTNVIGTSSEKVARFRATMNDLNSA